MYNLPPLPLPSSVKAIWKAQNIFVFIETETAIMSFNSRFYHFIGIVNTSDEREETKTKKGVCIIEEHSPRWFFYNSSSGPSVIMTDNSDELYQSLL